MPLGNLTSQFFANVYLNELDYFIKHKLKAKYYIRYVDDFIIFHNDKTILEQYKNQINEFLIIDLKIELHPEKSKVRELKTGIGFLGFRNFYHHKLLKQRNIKNIYKKIKVLKEDYDLRLINYDIIYDSLQGWIAFARNADTYKLRTKVVSLIEQNFPNEISTIEINKIIKMV